MNLGLNGGILILGIIIGGFAVYKLSPAGKAQPEAAESKTKVQVQTKVVKVTKPSGEVVETTTQSSATESDYKRIAKPQYGGTIFHDKTLSLDARLAESDFFLVGQYGFIDEHGRIGIRFEW